MYIINEISYKYYSMKNNIRKINKHLYNVKRYYNITMRMRMTK
jgi:hypothetical protein